jgi:thiol:disulfide interchange protein DsbC
MKLSIALFASMLACNVFADDAADAVKSSLIARYPATTFTEVKASPMHGLYEVVMGKNIAYTDTSGVFLLFGHMYDMKLQKDLTADELASINKVDVSKLPIADAIRSVHGQGRRVMYVFSDPECPYCKRLEPELVKIDDVTIYTFVLPLKKPDGSDLHTGSSVVSAKIWCAKDKEAAWKEFLLKGTLSEDVSKSKPCETPIGAIAQLGQQLGINGTPTMIFSNGFMAPGALSAQDIVKHLEADQTKSSVATNAKESGR